jgi:methionine-rich copper-binding protein CopC
MRRHAKRLALAGFGILVTVGCLLGIAGPAQAHNYLVSSNPSAGEVLTKLPADFSVTTNGVLLNVSASNAGFALQVRDSKGLYYGDGCVDVSGPGISAKAALGAPGAYTIIWQVVSTDGHPVANRFDFTWKPAAAEKESVGSTKAPDCHGTLKPDADGPVDVAPAAPAVTDETLSTALWIGGAVVAVGLAVVVTILVTSRKKRD